MSKMTSEEYLAEINKLSDESGRHHDIAHFLVGWTSGVLPVKERIRALKAAREIYGPKEES
jgi:hypothetical protein